MRGKDDEIKSIRLEEFWQKNPGMSLRYPKFGGLSTEITQKTLGIKFSSWRDIVDKLIKQGLGN